MGSVQQLNAQAEGGEAFLQRLRTADYAEASAALCALPGIGPKVMDCTPVFVVSLLLGTDSHACCCRFLLTLCWARHSQQTQSALQVAACICLFALDKHQAIPVDTHVWQLATRYYLPSLKGEVPAAGVLSASAAWLYLPLRVQLRALGDAVVCLAHCCADSMTHTGKTLTPRIMVQVEQAFQDVFGPYAGWAHNVLFISELASQRHRLPGAKQEAPAKCARSAACCPASDL